MIGERIKDRLAATRLSQSELARRVNVNQSTIAGLVSGRSRSSAHLHRIARALGTTPAYLVGETDDPAEDAPTPPPEPRLQLITMPVVLPSEAALVRMFVGLLRPFDLEREDVLSRTLARQLPKAIQRLQGRLIEDAGDDRELEGAEAPPNDRPARQRATRT